MKPFLIFISLCFCVNTNAQKNKAYQSNWTDERNENINIPADKFSYSKTGRLYYFIANGTDNLFIYIKTSDSLVRNMILKEGMTVWINMDRKLERRMGVRFPVGSQNTTDTNQSKIPGNKSLKDNRYTKTLSGANKIELIGFSDEDTRSLPSDNNYSFRGSVKNDNDGILHYELTMPLAKLPVRNSKDGYGAMPFAIGIEYGTLRGQNAVKSSVTSELLWIKDINLASYR
jgi:hypothetical protein